MAFYDPQLGVCEANIGYFRVQDEAPARDRNIMTEAQPEIVIYHNARCSKSRQALELLRERGIEPRIVDYLRDPPSVEELLRILKLLKMGPRQLIRSREPEFKEAGLDDPLLSDRQLIEIMIEDPILIERPIVLAHGKAALGRPPEKVLDII